MRALSSVNFVVLVGSPVASHILLFVINLSTKSDEIFDDDLWNVFPREIFFDILLHKIKNVLEKEAFCNFFSFFLFFFAITGEFSLENYLLSAVVKILSFCDDTFQRLGWGALPSFVWDMFFLYIYAFSVFLPARLPPKMLNIRYGGKRFVSFWSWPLSSLYPSQQSSSNSTSSKYQETNPIKALNWRRSEKACQRCH